jgi:hypothetical protein
LGDHLHEKAPVEVQNVEVKELARSRTGCVPVRWPAIYRPGLIEEMQVLLGAVE